MLSKEKLDDLTLFIRNRIMFDDRFRINLDRRDDPEPFYNILEVIMSLHNLLYESVTGSRYDYWFHWWNKTAGGCEFNEDYFTDELLDEEKEAYKKEMEKIKAEWNCSNSERKRRMKKGGYF